MTEETQKTESTFIVCELSSRKWLLTGLIAAVCLVVIVVHWPALSAQALSFDDDQYLVENKLVKKPGLESTRRFLAEMLNPSTVGGYYQPLTMISLMFDYASGGRPDHLLPFRRTSLVLHAANTALIIVLLYMLFGRAWIAAAVGLLFGVHPLTVEPIPWVGERKTLLAAFFVLLSLLMYVCFTHKSQRKFFIWSLVMYVLALMSKPTSTPLPVLMLLMDYWPLGRLKWRSLREKLPFFVIGGIFAVITYISQSRTSGVATPQTYGFMRVPLVICHNIIFYLYKMIWPVALTSHYPFPEPLDLSQPMVLAGVIGTCVLIPTLLFSLIWTRAALTGWLIFFIMVLPTMQVLQFSDVIASDKFIYLPSVGLLMVLAAFLGWICSKHRRFSVVIAIIVLILTVGEAVATRKYLQNWQTSSRLWSHMVELTPNVAKLRYNLGVALMDKGDIEAARREFETVLKLTPRASDALYNLASTYVLQDRIDEAIERFNEVLKLAPGNASAYSALAYMQIKKGQPERAIELYHEGLKYKPKDGLLLSGLGSLLLQRGQVDEAIPELEMAVKIKPSSEIYGYLGLAFDSKGQVEKAIEFYEKAIQLNPANAEAHYNLGNIYLEQNKLTAAISEFDLAIKARPTYSKAYSNLAVALSQQGRLDEAIEHFTEATKLEPNDTYSHFNLARVLADKGMVDGAIEHLRKIVELAPADADARSRLAELLLKQGHIEQATAEYEQVLKIDPNNQDAQIGLLKARDMRKDKGQPPQPASGETPANP